MRRVLIVFGVLASGTALSFGAAAAVFLANPQSRMVPNNTVGSGIPQTLIAPGGGVVIDPAPPPIKVMPPIPVPADGTDAVAPDTGVTIGVLGAGNVQVIEADLPPESGTQP